MSVNHSGITNGSVEKQNPVRTRYPEKHIWNLSKTFIESIQRTSIAGSTPLSIINTAFYIVIMCIVCVNTVSYTHLDVYKRQVQDVFHPQSFTISSIP